MGYGWEQGGLEPGVGEPSPHQHLQWHGFLCELQRIILTVQFKEQLWAGILGQLLFWVLWAGADTLRPGVTLNQPRLSRTTSSAPPEGRGPLWGLPERTPWAALSGLGGAV